ATRSRFPGCVWSRGSRCSESSRTSDSSRPESTATVCLGCGPESRGWVIQHQAATPIVTMIAQRISRSWRDGDVAHAARAIVFRLRTSCGETEHLKTRDSDVDLLFASTNPL